MAERNEIRENEVAVEFSGAADANLVFIGKIHTPWTDRLDCPRQGRLDGPVCRIEIFKPWIAALGGIERYEQIEALYWLHQSRRDLVMQSPKSDGNVRGTFSLRSPVRPNPIGTQLVRLVKVEGENVFVQGLIALTARPFSTSSPIAARLRPKRRRKTAPEQLRYNACFRQAPAASAAGRA